MTFPSGGSGYPQQGGAPHQQSQTPGSGGFQQPQQPFQQQGGSTSTATLNIGVFLALAVTLLGLVSYFICFSEESGVATAAMRFLLIGGLLAAMRILPKGPKVMPFAALASVLGALWMIMVVVRVSDVPGIVTVLLILGILQMLVAVAALLVDYDVVTLPAMGGQQQYPYSQPFPAQQTPYAQQPGQGYQPTQYGPPVTPANQPPQGQQAQPGTAQPSQQQTQYASQQGQFFPPQTNDTGESGKQPGQ